MASIAASLQRIKDNPLGMLDRQRVERADELKVGRTKGDAQDELKVTHTFNESKRDGYVFSTVIDVCFRLTENVPVPLAPP